MQNNDTSFDMEFDGEPLLEEDRGSFSDHKRGTQLGEIGSLHFKSDPNAALETDQPFGLKSMILLISRILRNQDGDASERALSRKMKAIIFINIYCVFDTIDGVNAKSALAKGVEVLDLTLARVLLNLLVASLLLCFSGQSVWSGISGERKATLLYRSLMLVLGQTINVFSMQLLPVSLLTIAQSTQAFWTALLGHMVNKEAFLRLECVGMVACFGGVVLMATSHHEGALFEPIHESLHMHYGKLIGVGVMVFVAANNAMVSVLARRMKEIHFSVIAFWFSVVGVLALSATLAAMTYINGEMPITMRYTGGQAVNLVATGLFSALNLNCLTIAFQNDRSATVSLLAYMAVVYAFTADIVVYSH